MIFNSLYILAFLCLIVVLSEWLVRKTALKHLGTALLAILFTAIFANLGLLPSGSTEENPVPLYDGIFAYMAPISIFYLLLPVNLKDILRAGLPSLALFLIGSIGTTLGVLLGMLLINGPESVGPFYHAVGGMFVGTYTGGSINFNALALAYDVVKEGVLYGGSVVVDNILTTIWMITTLAMPRLLKPLWPKLGREHSNKEASPDLGIEADAEKLHPIDLGLILALGAGALLLANYLSDWSASLGSKIPSILFITILALIFAQLPIAKRLKGAQTLGMFAVYLFLTVIGAFCDVHALQKLGSLGINLMLFAVVIVVVHGIVIILAARLLKIDLDTLAVVSQANVGGGTTALALARSRGRNDLVLPAVLLGALGNAVGTFLGFWTAEQLLPLLFS